MPFDLIKNLDGSSNPIEKYLLTDAEGAVMGEALKQVSGRLTKAAATDTPEFISLRTQAAEATSKTLLPVIRVTESDEFETLSTATVANTLVGSKVTIDTSGDKVTATTTSGVFLVSSTDGAATTSKVRGYFRR
jgi:hypothetical protein